MTGRAFTAARAFAKFACGAAKRAIAVPQIDAPIIILPMSKSTVVSFSIGLAMNCGSGKSGALARACPTRVRGILLPNVACAFSFALAFCNVLSPTSLALTVNRCRSAMALGSSRVKGWPTCSCAVVVFEVESGRGNGGAVRAAVSKRVNAQLPTNNFQPVSNFQLTNKVRQKVHESFQKTSVDSRATSKTSNKCTQESWRCSYWRSLNTTVHRQRQDIGTRTRDFF